MKTTKKLIGASVALIVAASLTVGSTLAWFTYQSNVQLEKVGFSVDSGDENLQVAVVTADENPGNGDFVYSLKTDDIVNKIKAVNNNSNIVYTQLTLADDPVESSNPIDLVKKGGTGAASKSDYATFDLVFRYTPFKGVDASNVPSLVLDYQSAVTAEKEDDAYTPTHTIYAWKKLTTTEYGIASDIDKDMPFKVRARDAARVAFVFQENSATKSKVWAPSEEFGAGVTAAKTSDVPKGFYKGNLASEYAIKQNPTTDPVTAPTYSNRIYAGIETPTVSTDFDYSTITKFAVPGTGETYSQLRITVKVWLEGKDGDCMDAVLGDAFNFILKFRTSTLKA